MKFKEFKVNEIYHDYMYKDQILVIEILDKRVVTHSLTTGRMRYIWECVFDEKRFELVKDEK